MADLGGGPVGVDAAIFIYFIAEHLRFLPLVESLFREVNEGRKELVTSALTLLEVLVLPYRLQPQDVGPSQRQNLRGTERGRRAGEHQRVMKVLLEGFYNAERLGRGILQVRTGMLAIFANCATFML